MPFAFYRHKSTMFNYIIIKQAYDIFAKQVLNTLYIFVIFKYIFVFIVASHLNKPLKSQMQPAAFVRYFAFVYPLFCLCPLPVSSIVRCLF